MPRPRKDIVPDQGRLPNGGRAENRYRLTRAGRRRLGSLVV